ncbi:Spx/MgsR family RNA polymerase-binding regulatory protein [Helicobacter sp. MIT 11-5569]|uniref:arsenate reductase family protein n=1 Tax=Helicobacter sp. MIT 11-5569 TaxID=1548151 RepID=UPI00051F8C1F|nr:Spx/MgsR family RNA polymerase-binding regulatory protein [Helicobacter sp. MIT 11-5569]TLD83196.1 Spx/MgsR family RNA polymerase-binding regulatory protein [Helicobacter sp. MIT 11-5569]
MVKLYGIKTCGSVKKAMQFLDSKGVEYTLVDFKKESPSLEKIECWLKFVPLKTLLNHKGTTYKKLGLKDKNLDDSGIKQWLIDAPLLIKRPVIESKKGKKEQVIVGFDEKLYEEIWG